MGNESSTPVDEATPPTTLRTRNIEAVAQYIKDKDVKKIVVMVRGSRIVPSSLNLTMADRRWH